MWPSARRCSRGALLASGYGPAMHEPDREGPLARFGLSDDLTRVVKLTASTFETAHRWATFDDIAYDAADKDIPSALDEVFRLPRALGWVGPSEVVQLSALGLVVSEAAPDTSKKMARLAKICSERKSRLRDQAKIGRDVLTTEYGFSVAEAEQAKDLIDLLPGLSGGGTGDEDWCYSIHRGALEYRSVESVADLASLLERQARSQAEGTSPATPLTTPTPAGIGMLEVTAHDRSEELWRPGHLRAFISHLGSRKAIASAAADELATLQIHGFVAHDDIEVSREWQVEIETALQSMDFFVALVHPEFSTSVWTQQEIGWALGRGVPC